MNAISTTVHEWPWPIISALCSAAALILLAYIQIGRIWIRRLRLLRPFRAYFLIPRHEEFALDYAVQDNRAHFVKELILPPNSEVAIQIVLEPRLSFLQR